MECSENKSPSLRGDGLNQRCSHGTPSSDQRAKAGGDSGFSGQNLLGKVDHCEPPQRARLSQCGLKVSAGLGGRVRDAAQDPGPTTEYGPSKCMLDETRARVLNDARSRSCSKSVFIDRMDWRLAAQSARRSGKASRKISRLHLRPKFHGSAWGRWLSKPRSRSNAGVPVG